jgi:hypothetical protein
MKLLLGFESLSDASFGGVKRSVIDGQKNMPNTKDKFPLREAHDAK